MNTVPSGFSLADAAAERIVTMNLPGAARVPKTGIFIEGDCGGRIIDKTDLDEVYKSYSTGLQPDFRPETCAACPKECGIALGVAALALNLAHPDSRNGQFIRDNISKRVDN